MKKNERGQVIVILALVLVGLLAFAGLAVDGGSLYEQRRSAQTAADASAFAAAANWVKNQNQAEATSAAIAVAQASGFPSSEVVVNIPPNSGPYKNEGLNPVTGVIDYSLVRHVQVVITAQTKTNFIQLVFPGIAQSISQAVVAFTPPGPVGGPNAIIATESDCADGKNSTASTVTVTGNATLDINGGNLWVNGTDNTKCVSMSTTGTTTVSVTNGNIETVGTYQGSNATPYPTQNAPQMNPLFFGAPDCSDPANFNGSTVPDFTTNNQFVSTLKNINNNNTVILSPGVYPSINVNGGILILEQGGLYCLAQGASFTASGGQICLGNKSGQNSLLDSTASDSCMATPFSTTSVKGIVIVMQGGNLAFNGGVVSLSAWEPVADLATPEIPPYYYEKNNPDPNNYAGLLIFADPTDYTIPPPQNNPPSLVLGGNNGTLYQGTIYAPNTPCTLTGTSGTITYNSQIYCYTITANGGGGPDNVTLMVNYNYDSSWKPSAKLKLAY